MGNILLPLKSTNLKHEGLHLSPANFVASLVSEEEVVEYYNIKIRKNKEKFKKHVVQIRRITKVVKGGKQLSFRAVVIIGDEKGLVGVGVAAAKEVVGAVAKAVANAKKKYYHSTPNQESINSSSYRKLHWC